MEHKCVSQAKQASNRLSKTHSRLAVCGHVGTTTCPGRPLIPLVLHSETLLCAGSCNLYNLVLVQSVHLGQCQTLDENSTLQKIQREPNVLGDCAV